jgi:hypothetical protein
MRRRRTEGIDSTVWRRPTVAPPNPNPADPGGLHWTHRTLQSHQSLTRKRRRPRCRRRMQPSQRGLRRRRSP